MILPYGPSWLSDATYLEGLALWIVVINNKRFFARAPTNAQHARSKFCSCKSQHRCNSSFSQWPKLVIMEQWMNKTAHSVNTPSVYVCGFNCCNAFSFQATAKGLLPVWWEVVGFRNNIIRDTMPCSACNQNLSKKYLSRIHSCDHTHMVAVACLRRHWIRVTSRFTLLWMLYARFCAFHCVSQLWHISQPNIPLT